MTRGEESGSTWRTPPPPYPVGERFPELAPLARRALRLHPSPGNEVDPASSHLGGALLWPRDLPWPTPRLEQLPRSEYRDGGMVSLPEPNDFLVPVIQLRREDFPEAPLPGDCELFQLLWNPRGTREDPGLEVLPLWYPSTAGLEPTFPPEPSAPDPLLLVPPCRIEPEPTPEFPLEVPEETGHSLDAWEDEIDRPGLYQAALSAAPGTKLGGHPWLPSLSPVAPPCCDAGHPMELLLSVSGNEWHPGPGERWRARGGPDATRPRNPTGLEVGRSQTLAVFSCPRCPGPQWAALVG